MCTLGHDVQPAKNCCKCPTDRQHRVTPKVYVRHWQVSFHLCQNSRSHARCVCWHNTWPDVISAFLVKWNIWTTYSNERKCNKTIAVKLEGHIGCRISTWYSLFPKIVLLQLKSNSELKRAMQIFYCRRFRHKLNQKQQIGEGHGVSRNIRRWFDCCGWLCNLHVYNCSVHLG